MLKKMTPDYYVTSVFKIDLQTLKAQGYRAIICDLDNTLVPWDTDETNPRLERWLQQIKAAGLKVMLVSNAKQPRIDHYSQMFQIPGIALARKPLKTAFRRAFQILDVAPHEVIMVGDQLFTDVLGAKRAGIKVILVVPLSDKDMIITRFFRMLEQRLLKYLSLTPN